MQIFLLRGGQQQGLYSPVELDGLLQSEAITGEDLCWYEGIENWIPVSQLPGFTPAAPAAMPPPPPPVLPIPAKIVAPRPAFPGWIKILGSAAIIVIGLVFALAKLAPSDGETAVTSAVTETPAVAETRENSTVTEQSQPENVQEDKTSSETPPKKAAEESQVPDPSTISNLDQAKKFVVGVWTYPGQAMHDDTFGMTFWEKWVIKSDGTLDYYRVVATSDDWGTPEKETYDVITGKYSDTGERYYGVVPISTDSDGKPLRLFTAVIGDDGSLTESLPAVMGNPAFTLRFVRGDINPFSK